MADQPGKGEVDTGPGEAYQNFYAPAMFIPWGKDLVTRADPKPGDRVLDVACGTGVVSRLAAERVVPSGKVTGLDIDSGFLAVARSIPPPSGGAVEFHEGSAGELPFEDGSFDLALCQQGLQFFPDRPAALAEMKRVLRPGGKLTLSVWRKVEFCPGHNALSVAIERHGGPIDAKPLSFSLTDPGELRELAEGAGFRDVTIEEAALPVRFESPERFVEIVIAASPAGGMGRALAKLDEQGRMAMLRDVREDLKEYTSDDGLEYPTESNVLIGYA
ncbi:MAG: methyltransferase domain-containing protein [bacterium]